MKDGVNPINTSVPRSFFNVKEEQIIEAEIQKLLEMKVLIEVEHNSHEYLSPIFVVPKKDGEYRMILNLKTFNKNIDFHHFKMDTFESYDSTLDIFYSKVKFCNFGFYMGKCDNDGYFRNYCIL